jgi:hypothetical protein
MSQQPPPSNRASKPPAFRPQCPTGDEASPMIVTALTWRAKQNAATISGQVRAWPAGSSIPGSSGKKNRGRPRRGGPAAFGRSVADRGRAGSGARQAVHPRRGMEGKGTAPQRCGEPQEQPQDSRCKCFPGMKTHPIGLEPITLGSEDRCSIQLSYGCSIQRSAFLSGGEGFVYWVGDDRRRLRMSSGVRS